MSSQHARHLARFRISPSGLFDMMKTSGPRCISSKGIHPDAKVLTVRHDGQTGDFWLVVEHESYPLVEEGHVIKEYVAIWTEYYGERAIEALGLKTKNERD